MVIIEMASTLSARQKHMRLLLSVIIYCLLPPKTSMSTTTWTTRSITTLPPTTTISIGDQIQPVSLTITAITSTSLTISWSHNYPVYVLYYVTARSNDSNAQQVTCSLAPGTMAQCSNLTPGHMYIVTVMATSGGVNRSDTKTQAIDPGMPGNLTNTNHSAPNVTLSWLAAPGRVEYYSLSVNGTVQNVQNCSNNSCLVTGLKPGTSYSVTITAYSYNKKGANRQSSFQTQVVAPDPPKELRVVAMTTNTVSLQWQQPNNTGGTLTGYWVCYSFRVYMDMESTGPNCTLVTTLEQANRYTVQGLTAGAFYTFQVYTANTVYNSSASANVSAQTNESVPGQVSSFTVANQGHGQVKATWQRPDSPHGNITNYRLTWNNQADTVQCAVFLISNGQPSNCPAPIGSISTIDNKNFSYVVMNLTAATLYNFTVVAFTLQGEGVLLTKELNTSVETPGAVSNVIVIAIESNRFTVQWMIPDSNPGPTNYTATAKDATGLGLGNLTRTCNATGYSSVNCTIQDLEEYWLYMISVTAKTSQGTSDPVYADNIKRTLTGVPGAATDLNVRNFSNCDARRVTFTWMTPPVLKRNAIISQYQLRIFSTDDNVSRTYEDAKSNVYGASRLLQLEYSSLKAEQSYTWQVQSLPNGLNATSTFTTGTCTPPGWHSGYQNVTVVGSTISSVTVKLETRFFEDDSQGRITEMFLVIAPKKNISTSPRAWNDWSNARATDFKQPYRLNLPLSIIKESKGLIEIGAEKCEDKHGYQCNGRLKEAFTFYLCAYVCTSVSCTPSPVFGPFTTNTATSGSSSPITAIVASVLVVVLVIIVVVIILAYRNGMQLPCFRKYPKFKDREMIVSSCRGSTHYRLVFLQDFAKYLEDMHLHGDTGFAEQYEDIQKIGSVLREQLTVDHANIEANIEKNRWMDILPYDKTRVKLQLKDDDPTSDYINASYIHGYQGAEEYIATQGPLPETVHDFWRMVFENGSAFIIMLVRCQEGSRTKCEQYWPSEIGGSRNYGDILVTLDSRINLETYNKATLTVSWHGKFLTVTHFHYLDFPDFSADVNIVHFIQFVMEVRESIPKDMKEPVVVHCSGGVGQTGTYIVLDHLYQLLQDSDLCSTKCVDVYGLVVKLREHRMDMVQTESQYIMIHECFLLMLENRKREMGMPSDLHSITGSLRRTNSGYNTNVEREYVNMKMIRKPSNKQREDNIYMNVSSLSKLACNPNASTNLQ